MLSEKFAHSSLLGFEQLLGPGAVTPVETERNLLVDGEIWQLGRRRRIFKRRVVRGEPGPKSQRRLQRSRVLSRVDNDVFSGTDALESVDSLVEEEIRYRPAVEQGLDCAGLGQVPGVAATATAGHAATAAECFGNGGRV